jgi:type I restriction enzyme, S subunit
MSEHLNVSRGPTRFRPYPAYKDSGVDSLGRIPEHWTVAPLYGRYDIALGKMLDASRISGEHLRPYLRNVDVQWDRINLRDLPEMDFDTGDRIRYSLRSGDLLVCEGGEVGRTAVWTGELQECYYQKALHRLRPYTDSDNPRFFYHVMQASSRAGRFTAGTNPNTIDHLTAVQLSRYRFAFPPPDEQRTIADFLDQETAKIDALVAKKERLIELLQEKRAALITRALTRGFNRQIPRKTPGIQWLRELPAHWTFERIKWVARLESGHTPDKKIAEYWEGGNIPWISLADTARLREGDYVADTTVRTTSEGIANSSARLLPAGTVVFSRDATIGLCAITAKTMAVSQHFIGWVCGARIEPEYLLLVLRSMTEELERLTMGATVRTIGMPDVKGLAIPVPPVSEQREIVTFVLRHRATIDSVVARIRTGVDCLKEFRAALISAAVTGKIDVREEVT